MKRPDALDAVPDAELWRRVVGGEPQAFGDLFERHARAIYNYCFRRTAEWASAEDLMSATFLHAWRRRAEVRFHGASVLPWLYGIAANLVRNQRRRVDRDRWLTARAAGVEPAEAPDVADTVAERLDAKRRMTEVLGWLRTLPRDDQDVFSLCVWQGLSYEETSVALGVPVGTVRSRLSRARERLRRAMAAPDANRPMERAMERKEL